MASAIVSGVGYNPALDLLGITQPSLQRKSSRGAIRRTKSGVSAFDDEEVSMRQRLEQRTEIGRSKFITEPLETDYDDVDYEIEDIQDFLVTGVEYFIRDIEPGLSEPPSLLDLLNDTKRKMTSPSSVSPLYFKKWMIDQITNGKQPVVSRTLDIREIKNIGLHDYFIDDGEPPKEGGLPLKKLLQNIVMYILAIRTGDLSIIPDIQSNIRPLLM